MKHVSSRFTHTHTLLGNQQGTYLVFSAIVLVVIIGFAALGIEVGRWYAVQGELGKSIDGAAFAGAKNFSNPNVDIETLTQDVAQANFPKGLLLTEAPGFTVTQDGRGRVTVDGETTSNNPLAKAFDAKYEQTKIGTSGAARLRRAEIALVLDVSGSMNSGNAIGDLRDGAKLFVENFEGQEDRTKMALLTFAAGVENLYDLDHGYADKMPAEITKLRASGMTNAEDALGQATKLPWEDQSGLPGNEKGKQVVVFFSDGNPNTFRGEFFQNGTVHEAANSGGSLYKHDTQVELYTPSIALTDGDQTLTGDGLPPSQSACAGSLPTVKWEIFEDDDYGFSSGIYSPLYGVDPESCPGVISKTDLYGYTQALARQMAIDHAQELKDQGIEIYTIGLGNVDKDYLAQISSGSKYAYFASGPDELEAIFQKIANILKLVLVA